MVGYKDTWSFNWGRYGAQKNIIVYAEGKSRDELKDMLGEPELLSFEKRFKDAIIAKDEGKTLGALECLETIRKKSAEYREMDIMICGIEDFCYRVLAGLSDVPDEINVQDFI